MAVAGFFDGGGVMNEHLQTRTAASMFDVSHMAQLGVSGDAWQNFPQLVRGYNTAKCIICPIIRLSTKSPYKEPRLHWALGDTGLPTGDKQDGRKTPAKVHI